MKKITSAIYGLLIAAMLSPLVILLVSSVWVSGQGISLQRYSSVLGDETFRTALLNSLKISLWTLICQTPVSIAVGLGLAKAQFRGKKVVLVLLLLSALLPFQAILFPIYQMAMQSGMFDKQAALIFLYAFSPVGSLLMAAFIGSIPQEQLDVARLETNSLLRVLQLVILPQVKGGVAVLWFINFADSWGMVEQPLILLSSSRKKPLSILLNDYLKSSVYGNAGAVLYALPVMLFFVLLCLLVRMNTRVSMKNAGKKR